MKKNTPPPPTPGPAPDLTQIEKLGSLLFSPAEAARICGRSDIERYGAELANGNSPAGQAYQRGRLLSEVSIRESLLKLAAEGSMPHAKQALLLMTECRAAVEEAI